MRNCTAKVHLLVHCVESSVDGNDGLNVRLLWRGLVHHFSFLKAACKHNVGAGITALLRFHARYRQR